MATRAPTEKEILIHREMAIPVMDKLVSLLLRGGAYGFWQFQRNLFWRSIPGNLPQTSSHINPEDLKNVLHDSGVQLGPDEHKEMALAYSDDIGFILVLPFFDALCPALRLPEEQLASIARIFPLIPGEKEKEIEDGSKASSGVSSPERMKWSPMEESILADSNEKLVGSTSFSLPDVSLESLCDAFICLFAPEAGEENLNENSGQQSSGSGQHMVAPSLSANYSQVCEDNISRALQVCYEEAALIFTQENYPHGKVPAIEAMNFLAAELFLQRNNHQVVSALISRLQKGPAMAAAPVTVIRKTKQGKPIVNPTGYSMVHAGLRWQRLFERYMNEDRRDEWLRGREERSARPMYMRHTCGFAGHLPEYKRHFGRTFHVIEENLPILTKPRMALEEYELRPDRFGPGRELRNTRNAHHYRLA